MIDSLEQDTDLNAVEVDNAKRKNMNPVNIFLGNVENYRFKKFQWFIQ